MTMSLSMMIVAILVGAGLRWGLGGGFWGLLFVNALGSLIAGVASRLDSTWSVPLLIGFCGCLTTFSGFVLFNLRLLESGEIFKALWNLFLHNALCLILCYVGVRISDKLL